MIQIYKINLVGPLLNTLYDINIMQYLRNGIMTQHFKTIINGLQQCHWQDIDQMNQSINIGNMTQAYKILMVVV